MGLFDFARKDKEIKQLSNELQEIKKLVANNRGFDNLSLENLKANFNRNIAIWPKWDLNKHADRYCTTDDIYSIVKMLAEAAARVSIYGYAVKDEKAHKQLSKIKQPWNKIFEVKLLQLKALTELPDNDRVNDLMEKPSDTISRFEFYVAIYSFLLLFGEAFILKERPSVGVNAGLPTSLTVLFPQNITLKVTDTLPRRVVAYDYKVEGQLIYENLPAGDVIHVKYFNPQTDHSGSELRGLSPLTVLLKRNTRLDSNMNTTVAQMQNGGVETIVYDKSLNGDADAVEIIGKRKENFYRFLKDPANAGAPYFSSGEMGAVQLGLPLAKLSALELATVDFKKLCNAYNISDILFNSDAASTESNVQTMEKRSYTNTILPNVHRVIDAFKLEILTEFERGRTYQAVNEAGDLETVIIKGDGKKRDLQADISEIPSLQADMLKMAQWMALCPHISYNEKREMMKFERNPNPIYDELFFPSGIQTAEDLEMVDPLPLVTEDGN